MKKVRIVLYGKTSQVCDTIWKFKKKNRFINTFLHERNCMLQYSIKLLKVYAYNCFCFKESYKCLIVNIKIAY